MFIKFVQKWVEGFNTVNKLLKDIKKGVSFKVRRSWVGLSKNKTQDNNNVFDGLLSVVFAIAVKRNEKFEIRRNVI